MQRRSLLKVMGAGLLVAPARVNALPGPDTAPIDRLVDAVLELPHRERSRAQVVFGSMSVAREPCVMLGDGAVAVQTVVRACGLHGSPVGCRMVTYHHPRGVDVQAELPPEGREPPWAKEIPHVPPGLERVVQALAPIRGERPWVFLGRSEEAFHLLCEVAKETPGRLERLSCPVRLSVQGVVFLAYLPMRKIEYLRQLARDLRTCPHGAEGLTRPGIYLGCGHHQVEALGGTYGVLEMRKEVEGVEFSASRDPVPWAEPCQTGLSLEAVRGPAPALAGLVASVLEVAGPVPSICLGNSAEAVALLQRLGGSATQTVDLPRTQHASVVVAGIKVWAKTPR